MPDLQHDFCQAKDFKGKLSARPTNCMLHLFKATHQPTAEIKAASPSRCEEPPRPQVLDARRHVPHLYLCRPRVYHVYQAQQREIQCSKHNQWWSNHVKQLL